MATPSCWNCGQIDHVRGYAYVETPERYVFDLCDGCAGKEAFADAMTPHKPKETIGDV